MSQSDQRRLLWINRRGDHSLPVVEGTIVGIFAWLLGYGITYVYVAPAMRDSPLHRIIETLEGTPATYELVGWVFFNAHFVNTRFQNMPWLPNQTVTYIGGADGFTVLLYAVPIATLFVGGVVLARYASTTVKPRSGATVGLTALPGYFLMTIMSIYLTEVSVGAASGMPDPIPAILLAGLVYPLIFAGGGGAIAASLWSESDHDDAM